ncbi:MAG: type I-E CRISPR-associated protein Cse1/CasA [Amphritea sp.]|nr:type I-E CRISPR-associated protein Cse1/CasA [Amphritea sp.]
MNLITDRWLPVIRQSGQMEWIAPYQIAETVDPVVELNAPRPDFQGGLYQFLIGLLQTVYAPQDEEQWEERFESPDSGAVEAVFGQLIPAMSLFNDEGPAFLQDFEMPDGEAKPIAALLIEAPGGKTLKDNLDHFIKGGTVPDMCSSCAASALFTLQTNAPSGGVGHRVGLRGGGPLTTLLIPEDTHATLWQKLWLNVLVVDQQDMPVTEEPLNPAILPWMGATRLSDKSGKDTSPEDGHPLQMYWGMPRRIRLQASDNNGTCSLCGAEEQSLFESFRTKNYGTNYTDYWIHPLTPFRYDPKKKNPPLSLKGQQGGLGYRHWIGLALGVADNGDTPAKAVAETQKLLGWDGPATRLWCFGYDMDNMKARCWYEQTFPVLMCSPARREQILACATELVGLAQSAVKSLRTQVKEAWFNRAKDAKGDVSHIEAEFWAHTETAFFHTLWALAETSDQVPQQMDQWRRQVLRVAMDTFDRWTLESNPEDLNLKRIMKARQALKNFIAGGKQWKTLQQRYPLPEEDAS